jgi:hypothetical protein
MTIEEIKTIQENEELKKEISELKLIIKNMAGSALVIFDQWRILDFKDSEVYKK